MDNESKNLEIMKGADNYNQWIYDNVKNFIGEKILEVGPGLGSMTQFFTKKKILVGTDISESNLSYLNSKFNNIKRFKFLKYDISKKYDSLVKYDFDTVVCINVLEHIKEDQHAINNMYNILVEGGRLILLVPAFQSLYGSIDKSDQHYRRYNKRDLLKIIKNSGFKMVSCRYMNFPGFFGWYFHSKLLKVKVHKKNDLSIFNKLVPLFKFLESIKSPPFGLSLVCICEKEKT